MNYLKQIYYEMRHHRMMTWVSISGTALSIFLVMSFLMAQNIRTVGVAPETNRSRILIGQNIHFEPLNPEIPTSTGSTNGLNPKLTRRIYGSLDGVEKVSYIEAWTDTPDVNVRGEESITITGRNVDENFWKIYDFKFIDGRPFDEAERKADSPMVIITRTTARRLFGEDNVSGREIEVDMKPYTIVGVVEDVSPLLSISYAEIYGIYNVETAGYDNGWDHDWAGSANALLLLKDGKEIGEVKAEVERIYKSLAPEGAAGNLKLIYHDQPYDAEDIAAGAEGSNNTPQTKLQRNVRYFIYAILVLLPAINLSSMTRSRLRHRVAEIGVRRAFGARRVDIISQLFGENLIITLMGGIIGLLLSVIFLYFASSLLFTFHQGSQLSMDILNARPEMGMLFRWDNFLAALGICLILNVLSATIPAWKASLTNPSDALSSR